MELLAHSKNKLTGKTQSWIDHTNNVVSLSSSNAKGVEKFIEPSQCPEFVKCIETGALIHDLGKVDDIQQGILKTETKVPFNHVDAGTEIGRRHNLTTPSIFTLSHHWGLPNFPSLSYNFRDKNTVLESGETQSQHTDKNVSEYEKILKELTGFNFDNKPLIFPKEIDPMFYRMGLSCLIDADHTDTAIHFGNETFVKDIELQSEHLYKKLEDYEFELFKKRLESAKTPKEKIRVNLRHEMFLECKSTELFDKGYRIVSLPAPVGSGKTFSGMIHLLSVAKKCGLRRIFVVLPYTSIINQNVLEYKKALVDAGVDAELVLTANHTKLNFESYQHRHLSSNWKTQIIITTNVQFFETLSANKSRKLHHLAGSAIFFDEFHTVPLNIWKLSWKWIKVLTQKFGCYAILGSGTLIEGWNLKEFELTENIPSLLSEKLSNELKRMEKGRVIFKTLNGISYENLIKTLLAHKGMRNCLVVLDTLNNAATVAQRLKAEGAEVEHLSTSLCYADITITLKRILEKLKNKVPFYLVATSVVESGMDISFGVSYRERCSVESLIQTGGRTNRNFEFDSTVCYDFFINETTVIWTQNNAFNTDREVLGDIFKNGEVDYSKITEYKQMRFNRQLGRIIERNENLLDLENKRKFESVDEQYHVINSPTITVLVNGEIADKMKRNEFVHPRELQKYCVNVYETKLDKLQLDTLIVVNNKKEESLFVLTGPYDKFIGYMAGLI